jgi:hypothetical protein
MCRALARVLALLVVSVALAPAPTAHAGTYHVYACAAGGGNWGNLSWTGDSDGTRFVVDANCTAAGSLIGLRIDGGQAISNGASAGVTFTSPPGTDIVDFSVSRLLDFNSNPPLTDTRPLYAVYLLGGAVFAGAGDYDNATRNRLKTFGSWYGHPQGDAQFSRQTASLPEFGALAGYVGGARTLGIRVGCFRRATNCSAPAGGRVYHVLYGIDVTVRDDQPPVPELAAEGLLASGPRSGSDPVVLSAADNAGIRRVELYDVTGAPSLVGFEDYTAGRNEQGATCSARVAKTCPDLARESVRPTSLQAGPRRVLVRTIDAGGNATDRGPFTVDVTTPSDRGARNGSGATDSATLTARFRGRKRPSRTVGYGDRVRIQGRLRNSAGQPIGGAELALLTTNDRPGASTFTRKRVRTEADGTFRLRWRARASQRLELGWKSHVNDANYSAVARLRLGTRATATLRPSTRSPGVGQRVTLRGHLRVPARGVTVILQGRPLGGRYRTFADTETRKGGRFAVGYRFRDAGSRGQTFRFRAKIRAGRRYPFETGFSRAVTVHVR